MNLKEIGLLIEMQPTKQQIEELKGNITECQKKWLPADKLEASKEFDKEGFNQLHQLNQKYNHLSNQYKGLDKAYKHIKDMFNVHLKNSILMEDVDKIFDFIKTEINTQPTDRSIQHFKTQIISYILPLAKQKLKSLSKGNAKGKIS